MHAQQQESLNADFFMSRQVLSLDKIQDNVINEIEREVKISV